MIAVVVAAWLRTEQRDVVVPLGCLQRDVRGPVAKAIPAPMTTSLCFNPKSCLRGLSGHQAGAQALPLADPPDSCVHQPKRDDHQHEQRHEAARPKAGDVVQPPKQQRQNRPRARRSFRRDHRRYVFRVVGMGCAYTPRPCRAHEEPQDEHQRNEGRRTDRKVDGEASGNAVHHHVAWWQLRRNVTTTETPSVQYITVRAPTLSSVPP